MLGTSLAPRRRYGGTSEALADLLDHIREAGRIASTYQHELASVLERAKAYTRHAGEDAGPTSMTELEAAERMLEGVRALDEQTALDGLTLAYILTSREEIEARMNEALGADEA